MPDKPYCIIKLSSGKGEALIDAEDYERVRYRKWYNHNGYAATTIRGKRVRMHHLIMNAKSGEVYRHLNHNRADNRKENLQLQPTGNECIQLPNGDYAVKLVNDKDVAVIDKEDYYLIREHRWYYDTGYAVTFIDRQKISMHHVVMRAKHKDQFDHRNRNRLDNRKKNLRPATTSQNAHNVAIDAHSNASGFKGVSWRYVHKQWKAGVRIQGTGYHLGDWPTAEQAARIYDAVVRHYLGEFAVTNFEGTETMTVEEAQTLSRNISKQRRSSRFRGVCYLKQQRKWQASIQRKTIGTFPREEDAARAYDRAAKKLYGDKARLNFPDS